MRTEDSFFFSSLKTQVLKFLLFFFKDFIYIFLERGKERNINVQEKHNLVASHMLPARSWPTTQACALTGNQTGDLSFLRPALNPLSHASQASRFLKRQFSHVVRVQRWCPKIGETSDSQAQAGDTCLNKAMLKAL